MKYVILFLLPLTNIFAFTVRSKNVVQEATYFRYLKDRNFEHIHIMVTPPAPRKGPKGMIGKPNEILIEVYNRTKKKIGLVQFDFKAEALGWEFGGEIESHDLIPGFSGGQFLKLKGFKENFIYKLVATVDNLRVHGENGAPIPLSLKKTNGPEVPVFLDVVNR